MDEIIYILIGVIWLAATIYKASQKNKKAQERKPSVPHDQEEPKPVHDPRSLIEELLGGQQIRIPEPEESEARIPEPMIMEVENKPKTKSFHSEYANYGYRGLEALSTEGISSLGDYKFEKHGPRNTQKATRPVKVDLRKAIIYQAILERPYT